MNRIVKTHNWLFDSQEQEKHSNPKNHGQIKITTYAKVRWRQFYATFGLCLVLCAQECRIVKFLRFSYKTQPKENFFHFSYGSMLWIKWINSGKILFLWFFVHFSCESQRPAVHECKVLKKTRAAVLITYPAAHCVLSWI